MNGVKLESKGEGVVGVKGAAEGGNGSAESGV